MKITFSITVGMLLSFARVFDAGAQLVADGATATVNGAHDTISGDLTIGTNGSFTTLVFTNAGTCTNSGNGVIGLNASAKTNRVIVTGAGSSWKSTGNLLLGSSGSFSSLIVSNGGQVADNFGNIALNGGGNCTAVVTGANSIWTNAANVNIGNSGSFNTVMVTNGGLLTAANLVTVGNAGADNQLIVAGGGMVESGTGGRVGATSTSTGNLVIVAGTGSEWTTQNELDMGLAGSFNQMWVTNGGTITSVGAYVGASAAQSGTGSNNLVVISGAGSLWTGLGAFGIGNFGGGNQMVISNGAQYNCVLPSETLYMATQSGSSNNSLVVTGSNALFSGNSGVLAVGLSGASNQLLAANGGGVVSGLAYIGENSTSSNNLAVITGAGSSWTSSDDFHVGGSGSFNGLIVTNGGTVADVDGIIGDSAGSLANEAVVTGSTSVWTNSGNFYVGNSGGFNELVIANSGTVATFSNFYVGLNSSSINNEVFVAGTLETLNSGVVEVRRGTLTMNSGLLETAELVLTNGSQSGFVFNGGTVQPGASMVANGSVFTVGNGSSAAVLQLSAGVNTFSNGLLIASNGVLNGSGFITGSVTNAAGGSLFSGASISQFTITGNLVLKAGSTNTFELNRSFLTFTKVLGINSMVYGGTLIVSNLGGTLGAGNTFKLFTASNYSGEFSALLPATPGAGLRWSTNELVVDGTLRIAASPTPRPRITSVGFSDSTHLAIHAGGGVPYEPVYLWTATNAALPLTNWTVLATNAFDTSDNAVLTIPFTNTEAKQFFVLRVQ